MHHRGQVAELRASARAQMRWGLLICFGGCLAVFGLARLFLPAVLGVGYNLSSTALGLLVLSGYYHVILYLNSILATAEGRARDVLVSNVIGAVANIVLCLLLVDRWGIPGVSGALVVSFLLAAGTASVTNSRAGFQFFRGYWAFIAVPLALMVALVIFAPNT
jgi:O-antigen/teichoic acid export membrane protein